METRLKTTISFRSPRCGWQLGKVTDDFEQHTHQSRGGTDFPPFTASQANMTCQYTCRTCGKVVDATKMPFQGYCTRVRPCHILALHGETICNIIEKVKLGDSERLPSCTYVHVLALFPFGRLVRLSTKLPPHLVCVSSVSKCIRDCIFEDEIQTAGALKSPRLGKGYRRT